ncbi:MAG: HNH endonuclease [Nitrososphaerales archaeon]
MSWLLKLAEEKERKGAESGEYPKDWDLIAYKIKALKGWCCERCGRSHEKDGAQGFVLTVHHLTGEKFLCEEWNLAALCQRCHLHVQNKVDFYRVPQIFDWLSLEYSPLKTHSAWMARHIKGYNVYAWLKGKPLIPLEKIVERDYSKEWKSK